MKDGVAVAQANELEVIPPDKFEENPVSALVSDSILLVTPDVRVDPPRRKTTQSQPSRNLLKFIHLFFSHFMMTLEIHF